VTARGRRGHDLAESLAAAGTLAGPQERRVDGARGHPPVRRMLGVDGWLPAGRDFRHEARAEDDAVNGGDVEGVDLLEGPHAPERGLARREAELLLHLAQGA